MDPAILGRTRNNGHTNPTHGQRGSVQPEQSFKVHSTQPPYRTPLPLPPPASPGRKTAYQDNPWEGQPSRYSDEALTNELSEYLKGAMDDDFTDTDLTDINLTSVLDLTEDELVAATGREGVGNTLGRCKVMIMSCKWTI